nr:EOG090X0DPU [Triops cancriformis]
MVIKLYVSSVSGNKEVKKRQMKATLILQSKGVEFQTIDISDPGRVDDRKFMQENSKAKPNARNPIPPQFFNEEEYCGDYEGFDEANETDTLEDFLKLPRGALPQVPVINHDINGLNSREVSLEPEPAHLLAKTVMPRLAAQTLQEAQVSKDNEEEEDESDEKSRLKDEDNGNGWGEEGGKGTWRDLGGGTDYQAQESDVQQANQGLTSYQPGFDNDNRTGDDNGAQGQEDHEEEEEEEEDEEAQEEEEEETGNC